MGGGGSKWVSPDTSKKDGSTLVEMQIGHISDAHEIIGLQPDTFTPVTIVPQHSHHHCCCCIPVCWVAIPHGFYAIVTKWGKDEPGGEPDETWSSGFHCMAPWGRVSRLISQQLIVFDTPVKEVKTKDNITVSLDVLIVFEVMKPRDFIYGLGPETLDNLLRASQEEVLRALAVETPVQEIYDLHGTDTTEFVRTMNGEFNKYGVQIKSFTVRNVEIPQPMAKDFEEKTLYESKTEEQKVKQTLDRLNLNNTEEKQKLQEECENSSMKEDEQNIIAKVNLQKETAEVEASVSKEIALFNAQRDADVEDIYATAKLEVVKTKCEVTRMKMESEALVEQEVDVLMAEAQAFKARTLAEATTESAQRRSEATKVLFLAEGKATESFQAMRAQEQELRRLEILSKLAGNNKIRVVTSMENNMGLAPDNSLVAQISQQGMEAFRMKLAEVTAGSTDKVKMKSKIAGGLVRPVPSQQIMS